MMIQSEKVFEIDDSKTFAENIEVFFEALASIDPDLAGSLKATVLSSGQAIIDKHAIWEALSEKAQSGGQND